MQTLSAVVFSKQSERTITSCVNSVRFAQEVVLIDMGGTDSSVSLVRNMVDYVYEKKTDIVERVRNFGADKARNEWVLMIDADEEVSPTLATYITTLLSHPDDYTAVALPRKNMMFGRFISHTGWWPDHQIRLYKKGSVRWNETIHTPPTIEGTLLSLPADESLALIHHHIHTVDEYLGRIQLFTKVQAEQSRDQSSPEKATTAFREEFMRRYFAQEGYKDGDVGLYLSLLQSFYQFITQLRLWEKNGFPTQQVQTDKMIDTLVSDLRYWQTTRALSQHLPPYKQWWYLLRRKFRI